jgi:hypothetical protein
LGKSGSLLLKFALVQLYVAEHCVADYAGHFNLSTLIPIDHIVGRSLIDKTIDPIKTGLPHSEVELIDLKDNVSTNPLPL